MGKPRHPLKRTEVFEIVKRLVKEDQYVGTRDIPLFYKVFEEFPDAPFWRVYQLEFQLNCIAWFLSPEGRDRLTTDIAVFHLDIEPQPTYDMETSKVGEDAPIARPKTTVASLFKT